MWSCLCNRYLKAMTLTHFSPIFRCTVADCSCRGTPSTICRSKKTTTCSSKRACQTKDSTTTTTIFKSRSTPHVEIQICLCPRQTPNQHWSIQLGCPKAKVVKRLCWLAITWSFHPVLEHCTLGFEVVETFVRFQYPLILQIAKTNTKACVSGRMIPGGRINNMKRGHLKKRSVSIICFLTS